MTPNAIIIGSGHYVTGKTELDNKKKTDKDMGVLLPGIAYLKKINKINEIFLVSVNGNSLNKKIKAWRSQTKEIFKGIKIETFPNKGQFDKNAYKKILQNIKKPCVAFIATPDHTHKKIIKDCIENEVPFFVVKPAVTNLKDFYQLNDSLENSSISGMVDYHKVFDESNILTRDAINSKKLGDLYHISSVMTQRKTMLEIYKRWLSKKGAPNINHYLGSHYIHLTSFLTQATPLEVRATSQKLGKDFKNFSNIPSMIQTQIKWKKNKDFFHSYHLSGWADPENTESMTTQELTVFGSKGKLCSDQKFRGTYSVTNEEGYEVENPYFFNLRQDLNDQINLKNKYGFISIENFVDACIDCGFKKFKKNFRGPSFQESENVTAILEAADLSIKNSNKIVKIFSENKKYKLRIL